MTKEKLWVRNASNFLIVNSIFAALVGILLVFIFQDNDLKLHWFLPILFLGFSFWCFARSSEQITTTIDELDVKKYVYIINFYNFGVISLFAGLGTIIHYKYFIETWKILSLFVIVTYRPWLKDICFLLFSRKKFFIYLKELEGSRMPEKDHSRMMNFFYWTKNDKSPEIQTRPDLGCYTRLAPSVIHGVGVFAIRDILKGTNIFGNDLTEMLWIDKSLVEKTDNEIKKLYMDFCVTNNGKYGCPKNFNMLTVGWYLNNSSDNPNVQCTRDYDFIAIRDIMKGEELFSNYSEYSE